MKIYGILGHKIGYSLSPAMHNAAFKKLKLKAEYKIFDIDPKDMHNFLNGILRSEICGLNITVPYKQTTYDFLKKYGTFDEETEKLGAVNAIVVKNKSLFGYNTDGIGFLKSLEEDLEFNPRRKTVFIFGAGGAGTVCAMKLGRIANKIFVFDIDEAKIKAFTKRFLEYFGKSKLGVVEKQENIGKILKECELLINATPFGIKENEMLVNPKFLHKGLSIFDLIYKPSETSLIKAARKLRIKSVNGLSMLLHQGAASFELWTGRKAPLETMRDALEEARK